MQRIMIIGFSGCGKSTLAQRLGKILNIEPTHMDVLHWLPGWVESSKEHKIKLLKPVLERDSWIIEGSYRRILWLERVQSADTIIFLDYNRFLCLWRVIKRRIIYNGKTRPDMGKDCKERLNAEFLRWVVFDGRKKRRVFYSELEKIKEEYPDKQIYIFRRNRDAEKLLIQTEGIEQK